MVTIITRATAGTLPSRILCSQVIPGVRIRAKVMANANGIRISRATYSTAITAIRIAVVRKPDEPDDWAGLVMNYFEILPPAQTKPVRSARQDLNRAPAVYQVDDENHQSHHQQQMNQASADAKTESQKPQHQKHS